MVLLVAVFAAWMLSPTPDTGPQINLVTELTPPPAPSAPAGGAHNPREIGQAEAVVIETDEPNIPQTEKCTMLAGWAQRGVPHYTLLDNIRDQAMLFTEDDLACLTAARDIPPIVLRFAEMYQKRERTPSP
ncbi:MAG TPA: hypothetical protein ENK18_12410 [Deltaproteobacteria bacterium]|nr:hypothetical protein [Deltaproteobacteria bacterium]